MAIITFILILLTILVGFICFIIQTKIAYVIWGLFLIASTISLYFTASRHAESMNYPKTCRYYVILVDHVVQVYSNNTVIAVLPDTSDIGKILLKDNE